MATSEVQIANMSLGLLGAEPIVSALSENSIVERFFDSIRDTVLEDMDWTFAIKRVVLSSPDATSPAFEWANRFAIPSDCLRIIEVNLNEYDWEQEGNKIVTDQGSRNVKYVRRDEDVSKWPQSFVQAFSYKLAASICIPHTNSSEYAAGLYQIYGGLLQDASGNDGRQGTHKPVKRNVTMKRNAAIPSNVTGPYV